MYGIGSTAFFQNALKTHTRSVERSERRIASGKRVNSARDDVAGIGLISKFKAQIRGTEAAQRNVNDGLAVLDTTFSGLSQVSDSLQRIREIKVEANNGTLTGADLDAAQAEINELVGGIQSINDNGVFNGASLFDGSYNVDIQAGPNQGETISLDLSTGASEVNLAVDSTAAGSIGENGVSLETIQVGADNVTAQDGSTTAVTGTLEEIDAMINNVSRMQSVVGAKSNVLEQRVEYLGVQRASYESSRSAIEDADIALESSNLTKSQILQDSAITILAQANANRQSILNLIP
jgi:flagellin